MKRILWGSLLVLLLAACGTNQPDLPQATNTFNFTVDPAAQSVKFVAAPAGAVTAQAEDGSRVLVPGTDLNLESSEFTFLPGNVLAIDAVFKNVSDQTFTNLSFSRAAGSSNVVSSTEPGVVVTFNPGESTGTLRFTVQHRGQPFTYAVEARATVGETGGADCTDPVNIPDDVLRQGILYELQKTGEDITCADMATLTELYLDGNPEIEGDPANFIENLEGLQYAVNLKSLTLTNQPPLKDLTPLGSLTKLTNLIIANSAIEDISPLRNLVNLEGLIIVYSSVKDISPLSSLTKLESLYLDANKITNIDALANLVNLGSLNLPLNFITDISSLRTNVSLGDGDDRIDLTQNCLNLLPGSQASQDIDVLEGRNPDIQNVFSDGQRSDETCGQQPPPPPPAEDCTDPVNIPDFNLNLSIRAELQKPEGDITCADMATLTELTAGNYENGEDNNVFFDLEGLQFAINLKKLKFDIADDEANSSYLDPLENLINLTELTIGDEYDFPEDLPDLDFGVLGGLSNLTHLSLPRARVSDIDFLSNLTKLTYLGLVDSEVKDFSPLANLTSLQQLFVGGGVLEGVSIPFSDISILSNLTNLTDLDLSNNLISDISALKNLTKLVNLDLTANAVSDIGVLSGLTNLVRLELYFNKISDIEPLSELENLQQLYIGYNQISNSELSRLQGLQRLIALSLNGNKISDLSALLANPVLGLYDNSSVSLNSNCLDTSPGSDDLKDIATLEDRNPGSKNIYYDSQENCTP